MVNQRQMGDGEDRIIPGVETAQLKNTENIIQKRAILWYAKVYHNFLNQPPTFSRNLSTGQSKKLH